MSPRARIAATVSLLLGVACAATGEPVAEIEGREWRLVQLHDRDAGELAALRERPSVRFEAGRLRVFGGCNHLSGSASIDGDRVRVAALAGTLMACPDPAGAIETAFTQALAGVWVARVEGDRLTLSSDNQSDSRLVFEAAPPPRLEGVTWVITGYNNGRQAVVSPLGGTEPTITFADGVASGDAGCNRFRASYTRDGTTLAIDAPAATRKLCPGEGVMEQERDLLAAIQSATVWAIDRGMLDMHRPDGERALTAIPRAD